MTGSLWLEIDGIVLEVLEKRDVLEESDFLAHGNSDTRSFLWRLDIPDEEGEDFLLGFVFLPQVLRNICNHFLSSFMMLDSVWACLRVGIVSTTSDPLEALAYEAEEDATFFPWKLKISELGEKHLIFWILLFLGVLIGALEELEKARPGGDVADDTERSTADQDDLGLFLPRQFGPRHTAPLLHSTQNGELMKDGSSWPPGPCRE